MARGVPFTEDEYVLCTYAAFYGDEELGGFAAMNLNGHHLRSIEHNSIEDKIRNIVADLDGQGIRRSPKWTPFAGTTTGGGPRYTGWKIVEPQTRLSRQALLDKCLSILSSRSSLQTSTEPDRHITHDTP